MMTSSFELPSEKKLREAEKFLNICADNRWQMTNLKQMAGKQHSLQAN